jgi:predicted dehydrogenase
VATTRTEDNFGAILELEGSSDAMVTVGGCRASGGRSGLIDVAGAEGQLVGDHLHHFAYRLRGLERTPIDLAPSTQTVREVLDAFARLLATKEPPRATLEDGARAVAIADACLRAGESGDPVDVEPLEAP